MTAESIHGISTELSQEQGIPLQEGLELFNLALQKTSFIVGQNVSFDINIIGCEFYRLGIKNNLETLPLLDTCTEHTAQLCQISGGRGGKFKLPTLTELYNRLFDTDFGEAHNATADVEATTRCFLELIRLRQFTAEQLNVSTEYFEQFLEKNPEEIKVIGLKHINLKKESDKIRKRVESKKESEDTIVSISKFGGFRKRTICSFTQSYTVFCAAIYHTN